MHDAIKRFELPGEIDDSSIPRLRPQLEQMLVQKMRDSGYVPVFDLDPQWSTTFVQDGDKNNFTFKLSIYGVYVGRKQSWRVDGILNGRIMARNTPPTKSSEFSENVELE